MQYVYNAEVNGLLTKKEQIALPFNREKHINM